ncbi:FAD-binding oxidoreductase [Derxia gummosa]|uniref:FAD-binding oxidoreductase n=1 Tax=Derxia gummosa DSM 723 TaxID=1121388 RepID=A0A8B6X398_9BURK|nr:FAD-binding oxidoreductase [Derxia gummosa]
MNSDPFIEELRALVGDHGLLLGDDMTPHLTGARYGAGRARCVIRPASIDEVREVVKLCVREGVRLVPQGANTGLVGASTPDASGGQVVLSLSRLRGHCEIDVANRSVTVDAGMTLWALNERLEPHGLWFPIDLGADPSIGGMVATNTGGTRLVRYGDVRHNLMALDVVLLDPPGELAHFGSALRKDNTGYDFKQLFVGTAGAGGVIVRATLEVHPKPRQSATALVVPASDEAVIALLEALERDLGDFFSAFEGMSATAMRAAFEHVPSLRNPFAPEPVPDFAVLIELESSSSPQYTGLELQETLNRFLEAHFDTLVANAVIGDREELWALRHSITEGARRMGRPIAFDVSVPRSRMMDFRRAAGAMAAARFPQLVVVDFGHIADGGIHYNLIWPADAAVAYDDATVAGLRDALYAIVVEDFGGSYSAEHGVGAHNLGYYAKYTSATGKRIAGGLRAMLDPQGLCGTVDLSAGG